MVAGGRERAPLDYRGEPFYYCDGGCELVGATITITFTASAFPTDLASATLDPPEGDRFAVDFDRTRYR